MKNLHTVELQNQSQNPDRWDDAELNSFGNLAMISPSFNSRQSNDDVRDKFSRIETQIARQALQSLKLLAMYNARENGEWTTSAMQRHEKEMIDIPMDSFSTVESSDGQDAGGGGTSGSCVDAEALGQ